MSRILGIDEVGRGPWAGPLVVGAVILSKNATGNYPEWVADLTDSKKLSKKKREVLSEIILQAASATGLGWVSAKEIDTFGLSEALKLATRRALREIKKQKPVFSEIIIDGTVNFLAGTPLESKVTVLKKADLFIKEVSAASIIAKVARDCYMENLAKQYPDYGFDSHVGYGTAIHKRALEALGPCPEHRKTFKPIQNLDRVTTKAKGDHAEEVVADFLRRNGHQIVARNQKTQFYEIDIISTKSDKIYFTEVKYRKSQSRGTSLEMITGSKLTQMSFAANAFLAARPDLKSLFSPLLAAAAVSGEDFALHDWLILS